MLEVGGSVFRCPWNLESPGSRCRSKSVLIRVTTVPVFKDLPGTRELLPMVSYGGALVCSKVSSVTER